MTNVNFPLESLNAKVGETENRKRNRRGKKSERKLWKRVKARCS